MPTANELAALSEDPETVSWYDYAYKKFLEWAAVNNLAPAPLDQVAVPGQSPLENLIPRVLLSVEDLGHYIAHLVTDCASYNEVVQASNAISYFHDLGNLVDPTKTQRHLRIMAGARRLITNRDMVLIVKVVADSAPPSAASMETIQETGEDDEEENGDHVADRDRNTKM